MILTWSLPFSSPPPPLPSTFAPIPLHPLRKLYLDFRIYISRNIRLPLLRLSLFQQTQRGATGKSSSSSSTSGSGGFNKNTSFRVSKLSKSYYIKWGATENEARTMAWIREMTELPVPKVYKFWSSDIGTLAATSNGEKTGITRAEEGFKKEPALNYMLIECLPGTPISDTWHSMSPASRSRFEADFIRHLTQLRQLSQPPVSFKLSEEDGLISQVTNYISALNYASLTDHRISTAPYGPFRSVTSWLHSEYLLGYVLRSRPVDVYNRLLASLTQRGDINHNTKKDDEIKDTSTSSQIQENATNMNVVFTHSDLTPRNILVDPETGQITGILDWECAGWNVEWWEGVKGLYAWDSHDREDRDGDSEASGSSRSLMKTWKDLLTAVVGNFDEELCADEEMRDIYGFPY